MDDSPLHRPSYITNQGEGGGAGLPTPTRAPYLTGDTRVGINSGVPWLGSHALSCACAGSMRAYAVCVRFHQVGATRGYYSRVGQPPQVASGASPPFIPSCLLSLLHPYKGGDMGGRRSYTCVIYKRQMTCALCVYILLRHVRLGGFKLSAQSEDGTADAGRCGESAGRGGVAGRTLGIRTSMLHTCDIYTAYYNSRRHGLHSQ